MPPLSSGSSSSKFTFVVSAALQSKDWLAALQALQVRRQPDNTALCVLCGTGLSQDLCVAWVGGC